MRTKSRLKDLKAIHKRLDQSLRGFGKKSDTGDKWRQLVVISWVVRCLYTKDKQLAVIRFCVVSRISSLMYKFTRRVNPKVLCAVPATLATSNALVSSVGISRGSPILFIMSKIGSTPSSSTLAKINNTYKLTLSFFITCTIFFLFSIPTNLCSNTISLFKKHVVALRVLSV